MQFSFSELKDLIFNASLGANLNVGTCEDVALAVAILESQNIHGSDEFLYAIACKRKFISDFVIKNKVIEVDSGRALFEGIYAIDLFIAEKAGKIVFKEMDCPMLLVGLGWNYYNSNFIIRYSDKIIGSINSGMIFWDNEFKLRNCSVTMLKSNITTPSKIKRKERIDLNQSTYKKLSFLSEKMLVPESEQSRNTGAGAGTTDND